MAEETEQQPPVSAAEAALQNIERMVAELAARAEEERRKRRSK